MKADLEVTISNNSKLIEKATAEQIERALELCGTEAEGFAKEQCPVDTGRLRNSISHTVVVEEKTAYIGTNVEYAPFVEYRDIAHKTGNAHFLRNAVSDHTPRYKELIKMVLKGGTEE